MIKGRKPKIRTNSEISLEELEKILKPKLIVSICQGLPLFALNWTYYFYKLKHYKKDAKEIYEEINGAEDSAQSVSN